jgi:tripartite-type tricarboxylate transporter receptor subunit TctC
MFDRRSFTAKSAAMTLAALGVLAGPIPNAWAADKYPQRPVRIVVALGPGSATDTFARLLADVLGQDLKGSFVVENKAGAAGTIGGAAIARAAADGYTIGVLNSSVLTTAPAITAGVQYDPRKDFTYLAEAATNPLVLVVRADSPYKTLEDFIAAAKKDSGGVSSGLMGKGSHSHFNVELLSVATGANINAVAYSAGTSQVLNAVLSGEVDSASSVLSAVSTFARSGKMRFLATTSPLKDFPDVPTFASKGYPQVNLEVGFFIVGPAGMPKHVTETLLPAIERALKNPKIVTTMNGLGTEIRFGGPKQLESHVDKEIEVVTGLARRLKLSSEK